MVTGSFGLLLTDALLDEVLCGADCIGCPADRHPPVARARCVDPFLRDLDVGAAKVLDLQQSLATWTQNRSNYVLTHLQLRPGIKFHTLH